MDAPIETFVQQIGRIAPAAAAHHLPDEVLRSLGGHVHRTGAQSWTVALGHGPLDTATVEVQTFGATRTVRVTFAPRTVPARLGTLSLQPRLWEAGAALPDSGQVQLSRYWNDLPSKLTVFCSAVTDRQPPDPADAHVHEIVCFVDER